MFSNNSTTKIASTDSPSHKHPTSNQQQDNLTNKLSNSFIRTATLPRRFKEKFLNKNLPQDQSIQSITSQHSNDCNEQQQQQTQQQQSNEMICNLNKLLNKYFKTIKYLEQIINKKMRTAKMIQIKTTLHHQSPAFSSWQLWSDFIWYIIL